MPHVTDGATVMCYQESLPAVEYVSLKTTTIVHSYRKLSVYDTSAVTELYEAARRCVDTFHLSPTERNVQDNTAAAYKHVVD